MSPMTDITHTDGNEGDILPSNPNGKMHSAYANC